MTSLIGSIKNINERFKSDLKTNLNDTLFEPTREETVDYYNRFVGKVVNNNDPDKQGACQIRVFGLFDEKISDKDLPWALPDMSFIGSKKGSFIVPPKDAIVNVYFNNGDIYQPYYTTKAVDANNLPSQKDTDYPDNMVMWETDEGDYLTINRKSKETTFNHNSGTKILIKQDGSVEVTIVKDLPIKTTGNITIESTGTTILKHTGILTVEGTTVTPTGKGPLCGIPLCLFTGSNQTGNDCNP